MNKLPKFYILFLSLLATALFLQNSLNTKLNNTVLAFDDTSKLAQAPCCHTCDAYGNCLLFNRPAPCIPDCECLSSADCAPTGCASNADCPAGYVCVQGQCVGQAPLPTPTSPPGPPPSPPPPPPPPPSPPPPPVIINPFPPPYVPCKEVRFPEFHSLRPYQASPCNQAATDLALFCGNDFILTDNITIIKLFNPPDLDGPYLYDGGLIDPTGQPCLSNDECAPGYVCMMGHCYPYECVDNGDGTETCWFTIDRYRQIAIDLKGAYLPIMGNTELVVNSQSQVETLNDAQKLNEYVSWYLNGVIGRAEYDPPDPRSNAGRRKIIDFSGPIKKLLSWSSQARDRSEEVRKAYQSRYPPASPTPTPHIRHDQVIGCVNAAGQRTECYPQRYGVREIRLTDFRRRLPPLPSQYSDYKAFLRAYRSWVRRSLSDLFSYAPFSSTEDRIGLVEIVGTSVQPAQPNAIVTDVRLENQRPAQLFFSHMEESRELARFLQTSFVPKKVPLDDLSVSKVAPVENPFCDLTRIRSNPGDNLFAGEISADLYYTANIECTFFIPGNGTTSPWGNLCRELLGGECHNVPDNYICDADYGPVDCAPGERCVINCRPPPAGCLGGGWTCVGDNWVCEIVYSGYTNPCPSGFKCGFNCKRPSIPPVMDQPCSVDFYVTLPTITETPLADEVWARLVAGPASVFKRIFPRIQADAPIEGLWDIPAATSVLFSANAPVLAGNPRTGRSGSQAELYFPHIGGIHEYFLNCIQKTLRPQQLGLELTCLSGPLGGVTGDASCNQNVPDSAIPGKWLGNYKANFLRLADNWSARCPGPDNNFAAECYNDVIQRSLAERVNPAFSLTIWLKESGASNYCLTGPMAQDFGINDSTIAGNFNAQLTRFLQLPYSGLYLWCRQQSGWREPMHAFLSRFKAGGCDPGSSNGNQYYQDIKGNYGAADGVWQWVNEPIRYCLDSDNTFSISWPTDTSCP